MIVQSFSRHSAVRGYQGRSTHAWPAERGLNDCFVFGLSLIRERAVRAFNQIGQRHHPTVVFVTIVGAATLSATILHAGEASIWASAYKFLGALPNFRIALLYSLNAITSYGHTNVNFDDHWRLMGALEALNGWLLFGLSTAFLFSVIEKVWSVDSRVERR
jgi:hypothetical protein